MAKYIERCVDSQIKNELCYVHWAHEDDSQPLYVVQAGWHRTRGGYGYGPMIRDHWLLHFIAKGNGILRVENMEYEVGESQIFAIRPHQITYYEADLNSPWEYYYIGFSGAWAPQIMKDLGFVQENSTVIRIPDPEAVFVLLKKVKRYVEMYLQEDRGTLGLYGCIYEIFQILSDGRHDEQIIHGRENANLYQHEYVKTLISIIENSFYEKINIQELANRLHLNRCYMSELFTKDTGMSIKQYLTEKRMQYAALMLQSPKKSITNVAQACGFGDSLYFSKVFKQYYGISPREYRKKMFGKDE